MLYSTVYTLRTVGKLAQHKENFGMKPLTLTTVVLHKSVPLSLAGVNYIVCTFILMRKYNVS